MRVICWYEASDVDVIISDHRNAVRGLLFTWAKSPAHAKYRKNLA